MPFIQLHPDTFFRQYEDIGFIWQQRSRKSLAVNCTGAIFISVLTRTSQSIEEIISKLQAIFPEISPVSLEQDFMSFVQPFIEQDIFIATDWPQKRQEGRFASTISIDNITQYIDQHLQKEPQLVSLKIELTSQCNLRCQHCYLECSASYQNANILPYALVSKVLEQYAELKGLQVTFTGGEPLLHPQFVDILHRARQLDLSVSVFSNLTTLNDVLLKQIQQAKISCIQTSIYSLIPQVHNSITGYSNSFMRTMGSIKKLIDSNVTVRISCPVMKNNLSSCLDVYQWGTERGIEVKIEPSIMAKSNFLKNNLEQRLSQVELGQLFEQMMCRGIPSSFGRQTEVLIETAPICGAGRHSLYLSSDQNYYPCAGFNYEIGNAQNNTLKEVWSSVSLNKIRKLTLQDYPTCMRCKSKAFCHICPALFYNESGGNMFQLSRYHCKNADMCQKLYQHYVAALPVGKDTKNLL